MDGVREYIFNQIEDDDLLDDKKVAEFLNISTRQLYYLKKGERDLTFRNLLQLTTLIDPQNYRDKMRRWCLSLNTTDCIKNTFEYAAVIRDTSLLADLVCHHKKTTGIISSYVKVYGFILDYMNDKIKFNELGESLSKIRNVNDGPLRILLDIYRCIALLQKRQFSNLISLATDVEKRVYHLNNKSQLFIKECYIYRLSEILAHTHLYFNNLDQARHYATILINANINKRVESDSFYVIGMSYLLSDQKKCLKNLRKSIELATDLGDSVIKEIAEYNYNYALLLMDLPINMDAHPALKAFELFKKGKISYSEAMDRLVPLDDPDLLGYFETVGAARKENLYKKFHQYVAESNLFYATIIVRDLIRAGEDSGFLRSLINLSKDIEGKGEVLFEKDYISSFSNRGITRSRSIA
ncbi:AimR family lysis-lysogeny pheromone receptor [Bacillus subtilis]|nr:AimR family lysis-lysogeny pheromone receptor [Bacillus subtilis]